MRKDHMAGTLNQEETLLFNLFKGKYKGGTIEIAKNTSVLINNAQIKHQPTWSGQIPKRYTLIKLNVLITESPEGKSKRHYRERFAREIRTSI